MNDHQCDALVFFGATGDLAYKKIFPSLQAMIKRGTLNVPIVGVGRKAELVASRHPGADERDAYEPGTWGPAEVAAVTPPGGWQNPILDGDGR
jgi:glucose-6-phosphate 1-dehydrogenase